MLVYARLRIRSTLRRHDVTETAVIAASEIPFFSYAVRAVSFTRPKLPSSITSITCRKVDTQDMISN